MIPQIISVSNTIANETVSVSNTIANETVSASNILANKTTEYSNILAAETVQTAIPTLQNTAQLVGAKMQSVVLPNLLNFLEQSGNILSGGLGGGGGGGGGDPSQDPGLTDQQILGLYVVGGVLVLGTAYVILS